PGDRRVGLRGVQQAEAGARRGAERDTGVIPRGVGNVEHIVEYRVRAVHVANCGHRVGELRGRRDGFDVVERLDTAGATQDLALRFAPGTADGAHHRESIELA